MAVSPLKFIREKQRRKSTGDTKFLRQFIRYFELRLPQSVGAVLESSRLLFPLVVPPQSISLSEPFSVEATVTQGGGLYVEEHGIVQRKLVIQGTSGFEPRSIIANAGKIGDLVPDAGRSYARKLQAKVTDKVSGQRHLQYLQDSVFRTYADLKRDPSTAADTKLIFHDPKEDEHWTVVPQEFRIERSADKPTLYNYSIDLLVVGPAEDAAADFSEDQIWLEDTRDHPRTIQNGADLVAGALSDVTPLAGELNREIPDFISILDACVELLSSIGDFFTGVSDLIATPYSSLKSTYDTIQRALAVNASAEIAQPNRPRLPAQVLQKFRQLQDGIEKLSVHPSKFERPADRQMRLVRARQDPHRNLDWATQESIRRSGPPTTLDQVRQLGTALTPGDLQSMAGGFDARQQISQYSGASAIKLSRGDTLAGLAARYLGDARLWQHIAILNGLKPPFLSELASQDLREKDTPVLHGVKGTGDTLLIPTFARPASKLPLIATLGVRPEAPTEEQILGVDFALEPVAGTSEQFDIPIHREGGAVDAKLTRGVDNVKQAIRTRLTTERGSDPLYQKVGTDRMVGLTGTPVDLELARFRIFETVQADVRVASVQNLEVNHPMGLDAIEIEADVQLRSFSDAMQVKVLV